MGHAKLSPSASHRWLNCTLSPTLEATVEDKGSEYAKEGTLAHAYAAKALKEWQGLDPSGADEEIALLEPLYGAEDMGGYVDEYVATVRAKFEAARDKTPDAVLMVESRIDYGKYVPGGYGYADAVIIADGTLDVIDLKYGKGVKVDAERNTQMMIYALGALLANEVDYDVDTVRMTIVQPRLGHVSEYRMYAPDLLAWAENVLKPKAEEALSGDGRAKPGEWCQFCKVKAVCASLAAHALELESANRECATPKGLLTPAQLAERVLPSLPIIKNWVGAVEEYALEQALAGTEYPGWKLVEGRSNRKISDAESVIKVLGNAGYDREDILKPAELKTITDLEKLVGKKAFGTLCRDYIVKPQGKPTLVPESDKREAINTAQSDFSNINIDE